MLHLEPFLLKSVPTASLGIKTRGFWQSLVNCIVFDSCQCQPIEMYVRVVLSVHIMPAPRSTHMYYNHGPDACLCNSLRLYFDESTSCTVTTGSHSC